MAGAAAMRSAFAPHFGHFLISEAVTFSIFSNRWPHLTHLYSYSGTFATLVSFARNLTKSYHVLQHRRIALLPYGCAHCAKLHCDVDFYVCTVMISAQAD